MARDVLQVTTLVRVGDRLALVIGQEWLDRLGIGKDTPLEVTTDGAGLVIRPVGNDHRARVIEAAERVMDLHEETLRELAR
jgi:hypothetical protein